MLIRNTHASINFGLRAMIKETKLLFLGIAVTDGSGTHGQKTQPEMGFFQLPGGIPGTQEWGHSRQRRAGSTMSWLNGARWSHAVSGDPFVSGIPHRQSAEAVLKTDLSPELRL